MVFSVMFSTTILDVFQNKSVNLGSTSGFSLGGGIMNELKCNNIILKLLLRIILENT